MLGGLCNSRQGREEGQNEIASQRAYKYGERAEACEWGDGSCELWWRLIWEDILCASLVPS